DDEEKQNYSVQNKNRAREILKSVKQKYRGNACDRTGRDCFCIGNYVADAGITPNAAINADREKREKLYNDKQRKAFDEKRPISAVFERTEKQHVRNVIGKRDQQNVQEN